jgi:nitrogen-specific signal transduction histidine kinase
MTKLTQNNHAAGTANPVEDHELWQILKPYVGHCLTLNHEINNSLTALLGYVELLQQTDPSDSEDIKTYTDNIAKAAERVRKLADRLSADKIELAEKVDLGPIVEAYRKIAKPLQ